MDEAAGVEVVGNWWGTAEDLYGGGGAGVVVLDGSTRPLYVEQFFPELARTASGALDAGARAFTSYGNFQVARLQAEAAIARARAQLTATPLTTWLLLGAGAIALYYAIKS
jgi:expansin (peptidoglycan-binding protein)